MRRYSQNWVRPKVYKDLKAYEEFEDGLENNNLDDNNSEDNNIVAPLKEEGKLVKLYEPRGAQIEALYELKKTREEGADKGLVVAATGT